MSLRLGVGSTAARRPVRFVAATAAVALGATAIVAAGGGTAYADDAPNAQAVGRFLDGAVGGNPIQSLADLKDARATAPGTTSVQNPLDVTALGQLNIPLTNAIKVPTSPAVDAGVVNQVATANTNGKSLGAAGAVARDGGAELSSSSGGSEPDAAKINLTDAAFGSVPIPGLSGATSSLGALGGITGSVHSVFARVATAKGGEVQTPSSGVAGVTLSIGSPALAGVVTQLQNVFAASPLATLLNLPLIGSNCRLTDPGTKDLSLADGGVVVSSSGATITVDVGKLIKSVLKKDISDLSTSNFDLVSFLVENLPSILADGVGGLLTSTTTALANEFKNCAANVPGLNTIIDQLLAGQGTLFNAIKGITTPLASAGASGLTQLADGLKNVLDIGLNVQSGPGIQPREKTYDYTSQLDATPNQATPVVENQTLVRAIEINVLSAAAIPGAGSGSSGVTAALANAAAGPSDVSPDAVVSTTTTPAAGGSDIPTGIPAGQASVPSDGGAPVLPIVAVLVLVLVGGAAFWQLRLRGSGTH